MHTLPKLNARYWLTLVPASTFGTNTGDVMSDGLGLGHVTGLPWIIGALLLVFMAEHASPRKTALFFWAAIIIIRAGAPTIGDAFHDHKIDFSISAAVVLGFYVVSVLLYRAYWLRSGATSVGVNPMYWITMVGGCTGHDRGRRSIIQTWFHADRYRRRALCPGRACNDPLEAGRQTKRGNTLLDDTSPYSHWRPGAGDALAHKVDLIPSTLLTGAIFVGMLIYFYVIETDNSARVSQDAPA